MAHKRIEDGQCLDFIPASSLSYRKSAAVFPKIYASGVKTMNHELIFVCVG